MKKSLALVAALMLTAGVVAQKDEMKVLKKIYDKETISEKDLIQFKTTLNSVASNPALSEEDRIYINFYKGMLPLLEMDAEMIKENVMANPQKANALMLKYLTVKNVETVASGMPAVIEYEKKTGKQVY